MSKTIKIRTKFKKNNLEVRMLLKHPMDVGRTLKNGEIVPAHFISRLSCDYEGENVMNAHWGAGVSKNPYVAFTIKDAETGGKLVVNWVDNRGESDSTEITV